MAPKESRKCLLEDLLARGVFFKIRFSIIQLFEVHLCKKPEFYSKFIQFIWHVLNKKISCFTCKGLFVDGQVNTWLVTFFTIIYERIPCIRYQPEFVILPSVNTTRSFVKSKMLHNCPIPVSTYGIIENTVSPLYAPQLS